MTTPTNAQIEAVATDLEAQAATIRGWETVTPPPPPPPGVSPAPDAMKFQLAYSDDFSESKINNSSLYTCRNPSPRSRNDI